MTAGPISRSIARVLCWSSTGNAVAQSGSRPAAHVTLQVSPKHSVRAALSNPITQPGAHNHRGVERRRRLPGRGATLKSP
jgi:hypothetical protein